MLGNTESDKPILHALLKSSTATCTTLMAYFIIPSRRAHFVIGALVAVDVDFILWLSYELVEASVGRRRIVLLQLNCHVHKRLSLCTISVSHCQPVGREGGREGERGGESERGREGGREGESERGREGDTEGESERGREGDTEGESDRGREGEREGGYSMTDNNVYT